MSAGPTTPCYVACRCRLATDSRRSLPARAAQGQAPLPADGVDALKAELAHQVVEDYARDLAEQGHGAMSWEDTQDLIQGLKNRLYGAGSLEALLRDERVEEIDINGWHKVFVDYTNGVRARRCRRCSPPTRS